MTDVIKIQNIYKEIPVRLRKYSTLREDLPTFYTEIRGKQDPNSIIGNDIEKNS